jgi:cytidine deaminase
MKDQLIQAALQARQNAYCPYSGYQVGAAVLSGSGEMFLGANFENISYGGTICAERSAVGTMVTAGQRSILELAVATKDGGTPCGICLQVLSEFIADPETCSVHCIQSDSRAIRTYSFAELLPHGFSSDKVNRTEG